MAVAILSTPQSARSVRRHSLLVRLTHWVNALAIFFLLMSGMAIFNAHPALYLGEASDFAHPLVNLGVSYPDAEVVSKPFPEAVTGPARDLPSGRLWHFFFVWVFVANGAIYFATSLILTRHVWRDLLPTRVQLRGIGATIRHHLRLSFPRERDYNVLQKLVYLAVIFLLLPGVVVTGLAMSPGVNALLPWLTDVLGGRQTARTLHFVCASLIALFIVVHLVLVLLSGVWNNLRSMITGRYVIDPEGDRP